MPRLASRLAVIMFAALAGPMLAGCEVLGGLPGTSGSVQPLLKADGWRDDLGQPLPPFAVIEIAYDRQTADRAWAENAPAGLPARDGNPTEPGTYGDLEAVDFDEQVVVVWSSGQSSGCPAWLADLDTSAEGQVRVEIGGTGGSCPADYRPYRMLAAVDRDRVPLPEALPSEDVEGVPDTPGAGGLVAAYPAQGR